MLLSAGEPIPSHIIVHGYLTAGGEKISKSLGNAVDPLALVQRYGVDAVRYWLLRGVPPTDDADYTDAKLERLYASDLADDLGNLLNRVLSMLHRYRNGRVPGPPAVPASNNQDLPGVAAQAIARLHAAMDGNDPQTALRAIWQLVGRANRHIEETAPWALWKAERDGDLDAGRRLNLVFYELAESLRIVGEALRPFLPHTADELARRLGQTLAPSGWCDATRWGQLAVGSVVAPAQPIFPKSTSVTEGRR
jgi:methionyl-tRNA synthetase